MKSCYSLVILISSALFLLGCPHHQNLPEESLMAMYMVDPADQTRLGRNAPLFVAHGADAPYNRIGKPKAYKSDTGNIEVFVDSRKAAVYGMEKQFKTRSGSVYKNLIYRVHFSKIPFSLIPFYLTSGKNVGLMVVLTLDEMDRPVLVTTVHTCGCYLAILPTDFLDSSAYPESWTESPIDVYGEKLPHRLLFSTLKHPRLLVSLRPGVHRVMGIKAVESGQMTIYEKYHFISSPLYSMIKLSSLKTNDATASLFHEDGMMKGFVKGSVKPWESFLLGLISLDFFVGTDKTYADPVETGNPFYTSLKPWNRNASNMWFFSDFLEFWGWKL